MFLITLTSESVHVLVLTIEYISLLIYVDMPNLFLIGLAQDRDRWRALVSAVRNLRVP